MQPIESRQSKSVSRSQSRGVPVDSRPHHSQSQFAAGTVIEFHYPADNRIRVSTRFVRRRLLVRDLRDLAATPLDPETVRRNPDLRRGPVLLTGYDWTREDTRSFYPTSMRSIVVPDIRVLQLGFYDPLDGNQPPKLFGPLWTDSRAELQQIRRLVRHLSKLSAAKPSARLAIGVFPVTTDTLPHSQAGMRVAPRTQNTSDADKRRGV